MTDKEIQDIAEYIADFYKDSAVDWDDALYRAESAFHIDLPESLLDPTIVKIKREVRAIRKARE